ncbi:MAG: hypothetical protein ACI9GK_003289 [Devosia sp.]
MGEVVEFGYVSGSKTDKCQELYAAFRSARAKADRSKRMEDDLAACQAWATWAEEYYSSSRQA